MTTRSRSSALTILAVLVLGTVAHAQTGYDEKSLTSATCVGSGSTGCLFLPLQQREGTVGIQLRGTFTATVQFEGSVDNNTYAAVTLSPLAGGAGVSSATAAGIWTGSVAGLRTIRVRVSAYTSGTVEAAIQAVPTAGGGGGTTVEVTTFRSLDLDETEEEIKATAGELCGVWFTNTATATRWLKIYNATAATVVVGTTAPTVTIGLPGNASDDISGNLGLANGCAAFATALTVAATTGVADDDVGAPAVNDVIVTVFYR